MTRLLVRCPRRDGASFDVASFTDIAPVPLRCTAR